MSDVRSRPYRVVFHNIEPTDLGVAEAAIKDLGEVTVLGWNVETEYKFNGPMIGFPRPIDQIVYVVKLEYVEGLKEEE